MEVETNGTAESTESTQTTEANTVQTDTGADQQQSASGGVSGKTEAGATDDRGAQTEADTGAAQQSIADAYKPNFKFKVKDKELEFDDFLKPAIKTKDLETKMREMYEKAHGIEEVKTARETFKTQAEEWKGKYTQFEQNIQTLGSYVKKGDFRTFFEVLNIPKDQIINYAIQELKYQELPPEQRQAIEYQRQQEVAYEQAAQQNQTLQQQMAGLVQQQASFELTQALAAPETAATVQAFDTRAGNAGAFKQEVIRRGQYYEAVHKISPPASQLVTEVLSLIGGMTPAQQGMTDLQQGTPSQVVHNQQAKPVISTFQGGGSKSPTRKVPTSLDDLRQMRQNL